MKYRNYFICFALGFALATSLLNFEFAIVNYLLFAVPMVVLGIAYIIAILRDTSG